MAQSRHFYMPTLSQAVGTLTEGATTTGEL